ncbi:MAG: response regulator, partial [Desulfobacterales bacterium]|nr:response regulator [Desulfobacterales bacterium]
MNDKYKYFKIEATEIIENLTKGLLELEKRSEDPGLIQDMFRYAHTLKGAANVVKLAEISKIAHKMEDRLVLVRDKKQPVTSEMITLLLDGASVIQEMIEAVKQGKSDDSVDATGILERLQVTPSNDLPIPDKKPIESTPSAPKVSSQESIPILAPAIEPKKFEILQAEKEDKKKSSKPASMSLQHETVRISHTDMDKLTNLSNEILINHLRLKNNVESLRRFSRNKISERWQWRFIKESISSDYIDSMLDDFEKLVNDLEVGLDRAYFFSNEMNDIIMNTRLIAVETYLYFYKKAIRDLSLETNRQVEFTIEGDDLLLDRSILDQIREPLYHILRNSIIHGIESPTERIQHQKPSAGKLLLRFEKIDDQVNIVCEDDGRGLDPEKLKTIAIEKKLIDPVSASKLTVKEAQELILQSGFSSAERITELAGRGVGMDVVQASVSNMGGTLSIQSQKGVLTRFTITVPMLMNMIDTFMVDVLKHNVLIPLRDVLETCIIQKTDIVHETGKPMFIFNGNPIPIVPLCDILGIGHLEEWSKKLRIIILKHKFDSMALIVNEFCGKKTILLKNLDNLLKCIPMIKSATILENGDPAFVLNIASLFERMKGLPIHISSAVFESQKQFVGSILVVDDSLTTRTNLYEILNGDGYQVELAKSGEEALEILDSTSFDLILTDVEMPGINGFQLAEKIRNRPETKDTPIVILTSLASDIDKRKGIQVGANAYIVKGSFDPSS